MFRAPESKAIELLSGLGIIAQVCDCCIVSISSELLGSESTVGVPDWSVAGQKRATAHTIARYA